MDAHAAVAGAIDAIRPPDDESRDAALALQAALTKPAGALGRLEELHAWAAGVFRDPAPAVEQRIIVVAAADHGVAADGVSAYPQAVTAQMVRNFVSGGAAVNVLARQAGAHVRIVDAGVIEDVAGARVHAAWVRRGSGNMTREQAMARDDALTLVARGIVFAREVCAAGRTIVGLGDMGIGNTTAAAAITSVMTGAPPRACTGRGTGIDDAAFAAKADAIERAIGLHRPDPLDPVGVLAAVGGCEIAFLAGVSIGAVGAGAAVLLDGYPTTAAALVAAALAPASSAYMLASHLSAEPGHALALGHLGLRPLLQLDMRLGEGTGAALAMPLLDAALRIPREMATFDSAGVARSAREARPET
ncbi:MAG TPA: nicotinate-nucleotide--dimethylbenzimidazole phosphoribosyltransferase [Candidatus Tectomicrobia bacterium]|nr:nicotinate-nucleotide--dimethylbenzimidazole phosphoribosyltransferase [Candidatus Tectomicrobia bacterium]